jgi:hypothetical protein
MAMVKEAVCRSTVWQMAFEARRPGLLNLWFKDRRRPRPPRATAGEACAAEAVSA